MTNFLPGELSVQVHQNSNTVVLGHPGPVLKTNRVRMGPSAAAPLIMARLSRLCLPPSLSHYSAVALLTPLGILWLRFSTRMWFRLRLGKLGRKSMGNDLGTLQSPQSDHSEPPELLAEQLSRSTHFYGEEGQATKMHPRDMEIHTNDVGDSLMYERKHLRYILLCAGRCSLAHLSSSSLELVASAVMLSVCLPARA